MISLTAEQALRALAVVARRGDALTTEAIALAAGVPAGSLAKVMQALVRAGLATSQRGPHGGFALTRAAHLISCLDVVAAVDPPPRAQPGDGDALTRLILRARQRQQELYRSTSIADLANGVVAEPLDGQLTG